MNTTSASLSSLPLNRLTRNSKSPGFRVAGLIEAEHYHLQKQSEPVVDHALKVFAQLYIHIPVDV
jgi:hypothetical protein